MPDRYWWGWWLGGLAAAAASIIAPLNWLQNILPDDEYLGNSIGKDLLLAALLTVLTCVIVVICVVQGAHGWDRCRNRKAALRGNRDAMPPATHLALDPASAPDVSIQPLILSWKATTGMRVVEGPLYTILGAGAVAMALLLPGLVAFLLLTTPSELFHLDRDWLFIMATSAILGVAGIILIVVFLRYLPTLFGRPYGVTANATGIEGRSQLGSRFALRWNDILLFEVKKGGKSRLSAHSYFVYGPRDIVSWEDNPANYNQFAPNGMTSGEMALRLKAMVNLVVARTGLQPRTFAPSLTAATADVPRSEASLRRSNVVSYISSGLFTTGVAGAVLALKPSTVFLLNAGIAVSLTLLALLFVAAGMRLISRSPSRAKTNGQLLAVPAAVAPAMMPHTVFQLQVAISPLVRAILGILGLFLCLNLAPAIMALPRFFLQGELPSGLPSIGGVLQAMLSFLLLLYGFVGLGFLVAAAGNRKRIIRADELGLSASSGMVPLALAWDDIQLVVAYAGRDTIASYAAKGKGRSVTIGWPAHSTLASRVETCSGSYSISPDEFAALVSQRSGKPVEVRHAG